MRSLSIYYMISCLAVSVCMFQLMARTSGIPDNSAANQLVTVRYLISCEPMRFPCFPALMEATAAAGADRPIAAFRTVVCKSCSCKSVIKTQPEIRRRVPKTSFSPRDLSWEPVKLIFYSSVEHSSTYHHCQNKRIMVVTDGLSTLELYLARKQTKPLRTKARTENHIQDCKVILQSALMVAFLRNDIIMLMLKA